MSRHVFVSGLLALGALCLAAPSTAHADSTFHPTIFIDGGGWNSLRTLDNSGGSNLDFNHRNFGTGYNFGGGLGFQIGNGFALRGVYNFARTEGRTGFSGTSLAPISGQRFDRHYYGGDLQFRIPVSSGFAPYIFGGGGAVTIDPQSATLFSSSGQSFVGDRFTRPAARFGLGFDFQVPNSGFAIFAQGDGWLYRWNQFGLGRNQLDATWNLGLSYKFGY
jgi:hypothetical protein